MKGTRDRTADKRRERERYEAGLCKFAGCGEPREPGRILCKLCAARRRECAGKYRRPTGTSGGGVRGKRDCLPPEFKLEIDRRVRELGERARQGLSLFG